MSHSPSLYVVDDLRFDAHVPPAAHADSPLRLQAMRAAFEGVVATRVAAREADKCELESVHEEGYVERVLALRGEGMELAPETFVSPGSVDAAVLAVGSCIALVERVQSAPNSVGFALVRPPGHHATANSAGGFCLFNNVAAAASFLVANGLKRVAIVDWDVHHGNGTQDIFYRDASVFYISVHQQPCFPGTGFAHETGQDAGAGTTLNLPMEPYGGDDACMAIWEQKLLPTLRAFAPEAILVSAGYDASERDPLAEMRFTPAAYAWMAAQLWLIAKDLTGGRLSFVLEGGYDLEALQRGLRATLAGLGLVQSEPAFPFAAGESRATHEIPQILRNPE